MLGIPSRAIKNMKCSICDGNTSFFKRLYDDRHGYPGKFDWYSCQVCGHKQLDTKFTPEELSVMYTKYYPRATVTLEKFKPHIEKVGFRSWFDGAQSAAFRWIPQNVTVLDIGCGFGETIGYHLARGCDAYGVEADENVRNISNKFGYKIHIGLFNPRIYANNYFDYVTMDQVIEHLADPLKALGDIYTILKKNGHLILATPNSNGWGACLFGARWLSWHTPYHINLFSLESITHAAQKTGFSVEKTMTITSSDYLHMQWGHLFLRSEPGKKSVFWNSDIPVNKWQSLTLKILHIIYKYKFDYPMTRLFDALNTGDNYLFFLRKK